MVYSHEGVKLRLDGFQKKIGGIGLAVSIKLLVPRCFCREHHAPVANHIIDDYRIFHPIDSACFEYVEHESGPELLLYLAVAVAGLGIARESLSLLKSAIELITAVVKARSDGLKQGDEQHGPLTIIVRGFGLDGVYFEKHILDAEPHTPTSGQAIESSLIEAIHLIAEERARQQRRHTESKR